MRAPSEWSVDLWLWVKLLFVPTLGILILTLFLLEESVPSSAAATSEAKRRRERSLTDRLFECVAARYCHAGEHEAAVAQAAALAQQAQAQALQAAGEQMQQIREKEQRAAIAAGSAADAIDGAVAGRKESRALLMDSAAKSPPLLPSTAANGGALPSYPHPLTLLSPARAPMPNVDYPLAAPGQPVLCNPQDLLAGAGRAARLQATMAGSAAAQGAQTLLLGAPAHFAPAPSAGTHTIRVNMLNEAGVSTIVTCPSTATTIKELMLYYTQKNNCALYSQTAGSSNNSSAAAATPSLAHSLFRFSYRGSAPITNDKSTLLSIGLTRDFDVLHVSLDFELLLRNLRGEMSKELESVGAHAADLEKARDALETTWKEKMEAMEAIEAAIGSQTTATAALLAEKAQLLSNVDRDKSLISTHQSDIVRLQKTKLENEGSELDRIEVKRFEKLRNQIQKDLQSLATETAELELKALKVTKEKQQLDKEIHTVADKTKSMEEEAASIAYYAADIESNNTTTPAGAAANAAASTPSSPSTSTAAFPPASAPANFPTMSSLLSYLDSLERTFVEVSAQRKKIDFILGEIAHKRKEINQIEKKVAMSAGIFVNAQQTPNDAGMDGAANIMLSNDMMRPPNLRKESASSSSSDKGLDHTLPALRAKAAQLERDTRDLVRWKSIAKHLEVEGKDSTRWRALWKAAQAREKNLVDACYPNGDPSAPTSSVSYYRARARAFEKEAQELRAWKAALANGTGGGAHVVSSPVVASGSPLGDFYAAAPTPLGNIAYEASTDADHLAAVTDEDDETERIEPQVQHARASEAMEEEERSRLAAKGAADNSASAAAAASLHSLPHHIADPSDPHSVNGLHHALHHRVHERITAELLAAEAEEDRLVQSMRTQQAHASAPSTASSSSNSSPKNGSRQLASSNGSLSSSSSPSGAATETDDEALFALGEALVRRNQHLQQHRLMVRYQQQQMALQAQQMQRDMDNMQHMQHAQQQQQQHAQQQQQLQFSHTALTSSEPLPNYSSKTGVLQASAPVFTPRFHDAASLPPLVSSAPKPSHYTKVGGMGLQQQQHPHAASVSPFGSSLHTSPTLSPSPSSLSWGGSPAANTAAAGVAGGRGLNVDSLDPAAYWLTDSNNSDALVGAHMQPHPHPPHASPSAAGAGHHASNSGSGAGGVPRHRSFSTPATAHAQLQQYLASLPPAHPNSGVADRVGSSGSSVHSPSSSLHLQQQQQQQLGLSSDPFTSFRHSQQILNIIDDDDSPGGPFTDRHDAQLYPNQQTNGGASLGAFGGASSAVSRGASGATSPARLPAFFSLSQQQQHNASMHAQLQQQQADPRS